MEEDRRDWKIVLRYCWYRGPPKVLSSIGILNGRTLVVVNLGTDNLIAVIHDNEYIASGCVGKSDYLVRDFLHLRGYTTLEVHIVAFVSFYKVKYLRCLNIMQNYKIFLKLPLRIRVLNVSIPKNRHLCAFLRIAQLISDLPWKVLTDLRAIN